MEKTMMKIAYLMLVVSMFALAACAMEPAEDLEPMEATSNAAGPSVTEPAELGAGDVEPAADVGTQSCFQTWNCEQCPNVPYRRDVLIEECDDGTQRVIMKTACGERDCF